MDSDFPLTMICNNCHNLLHSNSNFGVINDENYAYKQILIWVQSNYVCYSKEVLLKLAEHFRTKHLTREGFEKELTIYPQKAKGRLKQLYKGFEKNGINI